MVSADSAMRTSLSAAALAFVVLLGTPRWLPAESFTLDPAFQRPSFFSDPAAAHRARPDSLGRVYVSGDLTGSNGQRLGKVIRIDAASGAVDATFVLGKQIAAVRAIMVDSSDRLIVSGVLAGQSDTNTTTERIIRVLPDGTIDPAFTSPRFESPITLMSETTGGKLLVYAPDTFTGTTPTGLIRLNANGSEDTTFGAGISGNLRAEPVTDADGKILIGGSFIFTVSQSLSYRGIARLNANGTIDSTFTPPNSTVIQSASTEAIGLQSDGKIILAGLGYRVNGTSSQYLRLNTNGTVDTTFTATASGSTSARPRSLFVLPDNRLVAAGQTVIRVGANGGIEQTFFANTATDTTLNFVPHVLGRRPNGTFILATSNLYGRANLTGGGPIPSLLSFDAVLGPALGFTAPALDKESYGVEFTLQAGARLAFGTFDRAGTQTTRPVVRLQTNGTLDPTFSNQVSLPVWQTTLSASVDSGGKIFASYRDDNFSGGATSFLRLGVNGLPEAPVIASPAPLSGSKLTVMSGNKLLVSTTQYPAQGAVSNVHPIRRLLADGSTDPGWIGPGAASAYYSVFRDFDTGLATDIVLGDAVVHLVYPEGRILAVIAPRGAPSASIARLLPDGAGDPDFSGPSIPIQTTSVTEFVTEPVLGTYFAAVQRPGSLGVDSMDLGPDRSILVVGPFDYATTGSFVPKLMKLLPNGAVDPSFNVGTGATQSNGLPARIFRARFAPDGKIWVLGNFDRFNGAAVSGIVRLNANGSVDATAAFPVAWTDYGATTADVGFESDGTVYLTGAYAQPAEKVPFAVVKLQGTPLAPIPTATPVPVPSVTPTPTPTPTATPTPTPGGPTVTPTPTPTPTPFPRPAYLRNVSTRLFASTGDSVPIAGFAVVGGTQKVAIRVLGPTLANFGVTDVMADPTVELRDSAGNLLASNDNYGTIGSSLSSLVAAGLVPSNNNESAIVADLGAGTYTAVVRGKNGTTGNCLVEVYELFLFPFFVDPSTRLVNLSTRGQVGTGDRVMIGGFVVGGTMPRRFLVRSLGPTLANFSVPNVLADPTIELNNGSGVIASNDDWQGGSQAAEITASGFAPPNALEPAVIVTLGPGSYTAIVRGKNDTTGNAIVEVYELP